ncbi:MAG TPA: chromate resistance protein ChrB domain-containing protein [Candidatus Eisenbacteria bacterium]|nr:chromate resistance protein ChrB domain-containing protein [Candidatus Eisenbacteria bacterium]
MKPHDWLFLIHRVPARPLYLRARIRALLARAGAAPLKKAVYALPHGEAELARLKAVADEIRSAGGEAFVCEARFTSAEDEAALRAAFRSPVARASKGADSRWKGQAWVTRSGILVDRIACAWFIRRFLDPKARIRFAPPPHTIRAGERSFDMPGAEFSHEGGGCSLETLIARTGTEDVALSRVARIVHELDLRDGAFDVPEAPGVERLLSGIVSSHADDASRLERGMTLFDHLYRSFRPASLPSPTVARPKPRRPREVRS